MPGAWADCRHTLRRLFRRRGVAAMAVLTLALGIGATTTIFSIVDAALLRPLPWPDADRLVVVHAVWPERRTDPVHASTWDRSPLSWAMWQQLRQSPAFDEVGVWLSSPRILVGERDEVVPAIQASSSFLTLMGARPALGRLFTIDEDQAVSNVALLTHDGWHRYFSGRADIIGQTVGLKVTDTSAIAAVEIIGVLAPDVRFHRESPEMVLPVGMLVNNANYPTRFLGAVGRLASDASIDRARSIAETTIRGLAEPDRQTARVVPLHEDLLGGSGRPLWILFGGAGLLLLVACSSVAGLLIGEARARRHEVAIRATLGATRVHILRQLVIEHLALAVMASSIGLVFAMLVGPVAAAAAPVGRIDMDAPALSARVAIFAGLVGLMTPLLFGLVPFFTLSAVRPSDGLAEDGRRQTFGRRLSHRAAVIVQVALALVLVTGATMFGETMIRLTAQPLGFDPVDVGAVSVRFVRRPAPAVQFEGNPRDDMAKFREFLERGMVTGPAAVVDRVLEHVLALPGVIGAAGATAAPFAGTPRRTVVRPDGSPLDAGHTIHGQTVTSSYFETMQIPLVAGRDFTSADRQGPRVAVVSAELDRRLFDGKAVGRHIIVGASEQTQEIYEVIGIAGNLKQREVTDDDLAVVYLLDWQAPGINQLIVRTAGAPDPVFPALKEAIERHAPELAVTSMTMLDEQVARSTHDERFRAMLSSMFGLAALVLAAVGLYGLTARQVVERRREIGVRTALGARPGQVRALLLRQAGIALAIGLAIGAPAAIASAQLARSLLFGVSPTDPRLVAVASAVLAVAAIVATVVPAHRASRIDPSVTLRE